MLVQHCDLEQGLACVRRHGACAADAGGRFKAVIVAVMDQRAVLLVKRNRRGQDFAVGRGFLAEVQFHPHMAKHGGARAEIHAEYAPGDVALCRADMVAQHRQWQEMRRAAHNGIARAGVVVVAGPYSVGSPQDFPIGARPAG